MQAAWQHGGEPLTDVIVQSAAALPGDTIAGTKDDFGADIAGLGSLLLMIFVSSGLFAVGTRRNSRSIRRLAAAVLLVGTCVSSLGLLTACGGGGSPPPVVVTTNVTGGRVPRATYTSNGIVVDVTFKQK